MSDLPIMTDEDLQKIYVWVDSIPLSRPKRNISRDFSDGVLLAEIVHHYFPKLVELHNYSAANSVRQKLYNWSTLNQRVLRRLDFEIKRPEIEALVNCKPGVVEAVLMQLQRKISEFRQRRSQEEATSPQSHSGPVAGGAGAGHSTYGNRVGSELVSAAGSPVAPMKNINSNTDNAGSSSSTAASNTAVVAEKDATIAELRETVEILELKIKKLEQLVRLKDSRIQTLTSRLQGVNLS